MLSIPKRNANIRRNFNTQKQNLKKYVKLLNIRYVYVKNC
jgi:hypothetical protein